MAHDPAARGKARLGLVTVFGGTGFLGRRIVRHLVDDGFEVRAASRRPDRTASTLESNTAGLMSISVDVQDEAEVVAALAGSYAIVNCITWLHWSFVFSVGD